MRFLSLIIFVALTGGQAVAGALLPAGHCAIVLSSRSDLSAAVEDVRRRWSDRDTTIYKSSNGWYAITSQVIARDDSAAVLARKKAAGTIPQDAICSAGTRYVQRVARMAATGGGQDTLQRAVNAFALSSADQRYTQLGLAFQGHYAGLLDGKWGKLSQRALDTYARRQYDSAPQNWQLAALAFDTFTLVERDGWAMFHSDWLDMSYLFPFKTAREGKHTDLFMNWEHGSTSLRYSFARTTVERANGIHGYVFDAHGQSAAPYSVRRDSFAVTSAKAADGTLIYARSRYVGGLWSTVMISAGRRDANLFGAVTSSIADGYAPPIVIEDGGALAGYVTRAIAFLEREEQDKAAPPKPRTPETVARVPDVPPATPPSLRGTGSGFVVAPQGHILTNAHVIAGCTRITIGGKRATVMDTSDKFDLALLSVEADKAMAFARFASAPAPLNSDITVIGYPLSQDLGGLNVTRGSVSAAKGLGGDAINMQITAPIQPGNSGGPVVDKNGAVVGVVVSKLDEQKFAANRGIMPQNVNFAIRGEIAKLFLFQNGVEPALIPAVAPLDPVALAKQADAFTVLVECR